MTARNFGIHSRRPIPWGHSGDRPPASLSDYAPSDSILISSGSPLEHSDISNTASDIIASLRVVGVMLLFGAVIGAVAFWCMLL